MELLLLMLGGLVLAIPVMAIVALVQSGSTRRLVEGRLTDQMDRIRDLERQISSLRQDFAELKRSAEPGSAGSSETQREKSKTAQASESAAAAALAMKPVATPKPAPAAVPPVPAVGVAQVPAMASFAAPAIPPQPVHALSEEPEVPGFASAAISVAVNESVALKEPVAAPAISKPTSLPQPAFASPPAPLYAATRASGPLRKTLAERLRASLPLEEWLGMNLFAKIGIVLLVLGFALLGHMALVAMGPPARAALILGVGGAMLGGGIWLERQERYRLVGRTGIGGGWALLFFTAYAVHHVAAMAVVASNTLDCVLMLLVAVAMVVHTLRYRSQLVTGLAFLLAFSTVALSHDSVYSLAAGVILALGIVAIALRMAWFELEIFGILASYANHFYWLYRLYPEGVAAHAFPQFWPSTLILILYWLVFRISYVARRIETPRHESLSTIAALLNSVSLLVVMKFQSTRPELAFYALLALGALEFFFGQLPITRRRRSAFILLTVMGTILVFASAPFKFSGNNIALLWMIAAEVLLIAGIVQGEVVFRRLGLMGGGVTGLLVVYEALSIVKLRQTSQAPMVQDGVLLLACSALFYVNALFLCRRWSSLFAGWDARLSICESYLGAVTAFLGVWALFTSDWTAVGWAALMVGGAFGKRRLEDNHLLMQAWALSVAVLVISAQQNLHLADPYPRHVATRLITLPVLAAAFYVAAWLLSGVEHARVVLRRLALWAGTAMLAALVALDVKQTWVALVWVTMAVALSLLGRRFRNADLTLQEHVLAVAATAQLFAMNMDAPRALERYLPLLGSAVAFYAVSRLCTLKDALYRRPAAWAHTCAATALIAALAWHESPQPWITAIWAAFALGLAIVDRVFDLEELPYQAHTLAVLAVARAVTLNLYSTEKWRGIDVRLITVSILVAVLYALARWVRLPAPLRDTDARHTYTWAASGLFAWMLWSELQPISVALGLAVFGLLLFEAGHWREWKQIRLQAYVAFCVAFARIFFVNLTAATLPGETISPRVYTVAPIVLIYFFVWAQLQTRKAGPDLGRWPAGTLIAYLGSGSLAALLYFQTPVEWIIFAWAVMVVLLMAASLLLDKEVLLHQAGLLVAGIVTRGLGHNTFGGSYFVSGVWRGNIAVLSLTSALLILALPIAFRLRAVYASRPAASRLVRNLALRRPEQILFFAPVALVSFMIAVRMNPGMVTLSWAIEGLMVILLGMLVSQRSYRLTGLALLLLCVGKIVFRDAWSLQERDRYITFIVLGGALTLVSALYGRFREQVRRLL